MSNVSRIRFKDRTLVDPIWQSPVDEFQVRSRRRNLLILVIVVLVVIAVSAARRLF